MHHFMRDVASHLIAKFGIYVPDLEIGKENAITKNIDNSLFSKK